MITPINQYIAEVVPQAVALLALIVLTVATGLLVAIKNKVFDWKQLGDFMRTMVIPRFFGWLLLRSLVFFLSPKVIPSETGWSVEALTGLALAAYVACFLSLLGQALGNLIQLGVIPQNQYTQFLIRKEECIPVTDPHVMQVITDLAKQRDNPKVQ